VRARVNDAAARFGADVSALLEHLPPSDRHALTGLISRLLVAQAADEGIALFPAPPPLSPA
jgi:hypothetical protein